MWGRPDRRHVRSTSLPGASGSMDILLPLCSATAVGLAAAAGLLSVVIPMALGLFGRRR